MQKSVLNTVKPDVQYKWKFVFYFMSDIDDTVRQ